MKTDKILERLYEVSEEYPLQLCITLNPDQTIIKKAMQETAIQFAEWRFDNKWQQLDRDIFWNSKHPIHENCKTTAELFEIFNNEE